MNDRFATLAGSRPRNHLLAAVLALGLAMPALSHGADKAGPGMRWVGTWGAAPAPAPQGEGAETFSDQTLRLIVRTSIGGTQLRVRLSNEFGTAPLRIGAAHVALRKSGAEIAAGSDRVLTFSGQESVTIAPGAPVYSDPVKLDVAAHAELAVSVYLPEQVKAGTVHRNAFQTNYISFPGNFVGIANLPAARTMSSWPLLSEIDVLAPASASALVALGDSITDGSSTTPDTNRRWPDLLSQRLQGSGPALRSGAARTPLRADRAALGIVNRGIGGNRLLRDPGYAPFGKAALARFDRDVLSTAGAGYVIVLLGINDIGQPGTNSAAAAEGVTAPEVIAAHRQMIARARAKGLKIFGGTLTPFEGTVFPGYYSAEKETVRQAVNQWMRSSGEFDGVIDFDLALRDPERPARLLPAYDSGDHLHPSDAGMQAMANAVPLSLFGAQPAAQVKAARRK